MSRSFLPLILFSFVLSNCADSNCAFGQDLEVSRTSNWSLVLSIPAVSSELELSKAQIDRLNKAMQEQNIKSEEAMVVILAEFKVRSEGLAEEEKIEALEVFDEAMTEASQLDSETKLKLISKVLLPHQVQRLKQLVVWSSINRYGFGKFVNDNKVKSLLEIDQAQIDEMQKSADKLQKEFANELLELRKKFREKAMSAMKEKTRKKILELLGDESDIGSARLGF